MRKRNFDDHDIYTSPSRCGASPRRIEKEDEALSGSEYLHGGKSKIKHHTKASFKRTESYLEIM